MKATTTKLPEAAVGEILHVVNNQLNFIMWKAALAGGEHGEAIEKKVAEIAAYLKTLDGRETFDPSTFDWTNKKSA